ncbi:Ankyrin repeat-containing protein [Cynara cardunculus var. scolymus]|uniref:Ankyrin repeat-containing protein n=1 Tax=Cynara cardunculus var. scolymus TaxID=59895 RepID=A0A103XNE5_CYNCS|nr:Ankyrin repeat-containing protein [Cynara cardunculus var. scolymus]
MISGERNQMMDTRTGFSDDIISGSSGVDSPLFPSDISSLNRLSETLESILLEPSNSFADAKIILSSGREVAVHRCILSGRSPFFKNKFSGEITGKGKNHNVKLSMKELGGDYEIGFESLVSVLKYLYSGKIKGLPTDVCVCVDEECSHEACRPAVDFMVEVMYAYHTFQIPDMAALWQSRLVYVLDKTSVDDILVILSVANTCGKSCKDLFTKCVDILVKSNVDFVTLERALPEQIVKQIIDLRFELGLDKPGSSSFPDKHIKRVHRALDSDDVELVTMLLREGHTSLDGSCALHYAVAYADAKTTTELLDLALADVNHRNSRGFTVLHIAAMRKEPSIIVSLLTKGARPVDRTPDGRKALQISKRLTRAVDYYKSTEEGKDCDKGRLCIEILEQAERRNPLLGEASASLAMAGDDLRVAMEIAQVDGTSEFTLESVYSQNLANAQRKVDLNDAPFLIKEEHLIVDAEAHQWIDTPEERELKKQKYLQVQETLNKAFNEDKEDLDKSYAISSSSSSTSGVVNPHTAPFTFQK